MKKKLLIILFSSLFITSAINAQKGTITIGDGVETGTYLPVECFYENSYSQNIYLQSEIGEAGDIAYISFYFAGASISNSNDWAIYMGHTTKTQFDNTDDWVPVGEMTEVFNGIVDHSGGEGWITVDITDFAYNNTDNLVIAVDENAPGYNGGSDDFYATSQTTDRAIEYHSDTTNPDPAAPPTGSLKSFIANVQLLIPAADDAAITAISAPGDNFVPGTTDIVVNFANFGTNTLTACDINYLVVDTATSATVTSGTYNWSGSLAQGVSEDVTVGNFTSEQSVGYEITVTSVLGGDGNPANDVASVIVNAAIIYSLPFSEDFTSGYLPTDWTEAEGILADPSIVAGTSSLWSEDGFANDGTTGCTRLNIYGTTRDEWVFTPFIDLESTATILSFDIALTDYGNQDPPESVGDDDKFAVIISTDNGQTWSSANALQIWDNTTTPLYGDISTTGETISIDLSAYSGIIQLGFYGESTTSDADNDMFVDNIRVGEPLAPTYMVTFNVDMTDSIASGFFVEGTDQLWVGGSMNEWTIPGDDAAYEMTESATNDIYTLNLSLEDGDYMYKYFKIVDGTSNWDLGEWTGDPNRTFTVASADLVLDDIFGLQPGVSVSDLTAKGISIYPNPSNGIFTVNVENNFNLEVFDITGKVITSRTLIGSSTLELNTAGVYFLRFSNEKGSVIQRVIVQ